MQDNVEDILKTAKLNEQEEEEMREGLDLYEMTKSAGWQVMRLWLEDRAFHTWSDPRETDNLEQWTWREVNTFHAATTAKEQLEYIQQRINRADWLKKVKDGEIVRGRMKI